MKKPVIGITVDRNDAHPDRYESPHYYAAAIEKAGGVPLLLAYRTEVSLVPQIMDVLDGVLLSGGDDLDPALWGEQWHPKVRPIDPQRQQFELALLAEVEKRAIPVLGICFGSQVMNVYRGGNLIQFLPEYHRDNPIEHRKVDQQWTRHTVALRSESIIAQMLGRTEVLANTAHKQSVDRPGRGLRIIGNAADGVAEGVEDPELPLFLGVQWHPERLYEEADHLALFKLLVDKSRK